MNVYILDADVNRYRGIFYTNSDDIVEFNRRFDGSPLKETWSGKEEFKFVPRRLAKGDTPGLSTHIPVFSPKAVAELRHLVEGNGELLPITCGMEKYFLFNVTRVVDALDEANCELERFDDGRILDIHRYSFVEKKLMGVVVFKIPQDPLGNVFVTDPFVEKVKAAGLTGFKFPHIWSSQH